MKSGTKNTILKITRLAVFLALTVLFTLISVPTGMGYVNLGDAVIFVAAFFLGFWAVPVAAVGSAFADVLLGQHIYAPGTFFIKGGMALICALIFLKRSGNVRILVALVSSSMFMVLAYTGYSALLAVFVLKTGWEGFLLAQVLGLLQPLVDIPLGYFLICRLRGVRQVWDDSRSQFFEEDRL